jgi:hypothetical protein
VQLQVAVTSLSAGTVAEAMGFVTFADPVTLQPITSLTFTAAIEIKYVKVLATIPESVLGGGAVSSASFAYNLKAIGWPGTPTNAGGSINATASKSGGSSAAPPFVTITTPANGQNFTPLSLPTSINFQFITATFDPADPVITSVDATLNGGAITNLTSVGLNSNSVTSTATLNISAPGVYQLQANARNGAGPATGFSTFTVTVDAPPPAAAISYPAPNQVFTAVGNNPAVFTASFDAEAFGGETLTGWTATLLRPNNSLLTQSITTSALSASHWTGTTPFSLGMGGTYTLTLTATDSAGKSATRSVSFVVDRRADHDLRRHAQIGDGYDGTRLHTGKPPDG